MMKVLIKLTLGVLLAIIPIAVYADKMTDTAMLSQQCVSENLSDCLKSVCTYQQTPTCHDQCLIDAQEKCKALEGQE